ncbi:MAG: hypothetical protein ABR599_10150 [Gemmatimonadota bacterium]
MRSVLCTRCACACDDLDLVVSADRVLEARHACATGREAFLAPRQERAPEALVRGEPAAADAALTAAAELLQSAHRPLVWGLLRLSCEAQRFAVAVADRLGAAIDPAAGPNHPAAVAAFQEWGEVSASVGEVALQRGLVVLWLCDPARTHPRLLERWGVSSPDDSRVLRLHRGDGAATADPGWSVPAGREVDLLWLLREAARGARATESDEGGAGLRRLAQRLLERLRAAPYVLFVFDAPAAGPTEQHALRATVATLNSVTRVRLFPLRAPGNRVGAEAVLTWQTGFPVAVSFAAGHPASNGAEFSAARLLASGGVDAALVLCASPAEVPAEPELGRLAEVPRVVLDSEPNPLAEGAAVALRSAPYGIASGGTVFRMDGVALPLRPAISSRYPSEEAWLARLLERLPPREARRRSTA